MSVQQEQKLSSPEPLNSTHHLEDFNCGLDDLDQWLKQRSLKNEAQGASRTYVVCVNQKVIAYYCLAAGAVKNSQVPGRVRRNMPDPIPVMILGRLAVDKAWTRRGIGRALVRDAILRTLQAAEIVGIRAILVHAISEEAKLFYESCGFYPSPIDEMTLMITLKEAKATIGA